MDVRLTAEQQQLRDAAAKLADDLGPGSVHDLADGERIARLDKQIQLTGWRSLRSDEASAVEVAIVAEEFGRGLVDAPFLGPVLADDLARRVGDDVDAGNRVVGGKRNALVGGVCGIDADDRPVAGGVFDDDGFEAKVVAVDGGVADAEVVGEAAEEEALQVALAEIAGETGGGVVIVFEEGGIAVDVAAKSFAEDEFGVGDVEGGVEGRAFGVLEVVLGPKGLGAIGNLNEFVGTFLVRCGEGDMLRGMPVLRQYDVFEFDSDGVNKGNDGVAVRDCQWPSRHEVVLDVNDEKGIGR